MVTSTNPLENFRKGRSAVSFQPRAVGLSGGHLCHRKDGFGLSNVKVWPNQKDGVAGIRRIKRYSPGRIRPTKRRKTMKIALYARVSSSQQVHDQTIEQQLGRLQTHCQQQKGTVPEIEIFRDEGYSGATLRRPGLDRLRDQ